MTPNVFLSKSVILFSFLLTIIFPVSGQVNNLSPENKKLYDEIAYRDSAMFSLIYKCQPEKVANYFTDDLEFYHDKGGNTFTKAAFLETLNKNFCGAGATKLRRELVKESMQVFPMDNYGAIEMGDHRFYVTEPGQPEKFSGTARFTMLWKFINNEWKISRVLSYDHIGSENRNANMASANSMEGTRDSIYSDVLKEQRPIEVILPHDYRAGNKYDVLYVLDGQSNIRMTRQIEEWIRTSGFMPEPIIVGVYNATNSSRNRDLTPTRSSPTDLNTGGADNFLTFLQNELIPYINKKYSVNGSNGIYGHSLGGLFAMYALLTRPQVFDSYLAADPSFWWDNRYIRQLAMDKLNPQLHSNKSIFITGRGGKDSEQMGIPSIDSILKSKDIKGLQWKVVDYPGETHGSIVYKSVYDGLRFFYTGFNSSIQFHPQGGIVQKDKPYKVWVMTPSNGAIRYTTDGSEPTLSSPEVKSELTLNGPATLTIKSFSPRGAFDKLIKAEFKPGALKTVKLPKNSKPGGLHFDYYEGSWDKLPDFSKMKPVKSGIISKEFRWDKMVRPTNFGFVAEGYLEIKEEGNYVFGLSSDDGSKLYLGNQLLIDMDGLHASEDHSAIVPLEKGFYPIKVEYFQKEGGWDINVIYVTPSAGGPIPKPIPVELLYSDK
jgi:predicted alpha/beta superfamily hydrolase